MKIPIETKEKIKGKIQAWSIDNITNNVEQIFVKDYLSYKKNLTPNQYLNDLASIGRGISVDMEIKYVALSTAYDPPNASTGLELEFARVEPSNPTTGTDNCQQMASRLHLI